MSSNFGEIHKELIPVFGEKPARGLHKVLLSKLSKAQSGRKFREWHSASSNTYAILLCGKMLKRPLGLYFKSFLSISLDLEIQNSETESLGLASSNFATKYEPLLNRAGALYFCTLYYCVQKRGTRVPALNAGILVSTR